MVRGLLRRHIPAEGETVPPVTLLVITTVIFAWAALLRPLGFLVSGAASFVVLCRFARTRRSGWRGVLLDVAVSITAVFILHFIFTEYLFVRLPRKAACGRPQGIGESMARVLVADWLAPEGLAVLADAAEVVDQRMSREELLATVVDCDAIVARVTTKVDREVLDAAPRLRVVGMPGTGLNHIDLGYARDRGVEVVDAPGSNTQAVTELTLGLMLAAARHLRAAQAHVIVHRGGTSTSSKASNWRVTCSASSASAGSGGVSPASLVHLEWRSVPPTSRFPTARYTTARPLWD